MSGLAAIAAQLESDVLQAGQQPKVAFGSMDFEVFGQVNTLRGPQPFEVFIYAANAKDQPLHPEVTWHGTYVGCVQSRRGRYPGNSIFRPQATANDPPNWAVFWEIQGLERLKTPIPIGDLRALGKKTNFQSRFFPEGAVLIDRPLVKG